MHDIPYVKQKDLSPETISMMTRICTEVRKVAPLSVACGIQVREREERRRERAREREREREREAEIKAKYILIQFVFVESYQTKFVSFNLFASLLINIKRDDLLILILLIYILHFTFTYLK